MLTGHFVVEKSNTQKANPNHDAVSGQFTYGAGSGTRDREDARQVTEQRDARAVRAGMRQPNSGQLILAEQQARQRGESVNDLFDVRDANDLEMASKETGGSRVFNFSNGSGSDLDKNVKFATNTNANGDFERGALRVEIHDPETQKRSVYQRQMKELPALVQKVLAKQYAPISQHRRNTVHRMKAEVMKSGNPNHDEQGRFTSGGGAITAPEPKSFMGRDIVDSFVMRDGKQSVSLQSPKENQSAGWAIYQHSRYTSGSKQGKRYDFLIARNARPNGESEIRGEFEKLKSYHVRPEMKADGQWVTLPSGARIRISGGGGGAPNQGQQPQSQTEAKPTEAARDDSANSLTHAQRETIVKKLAAKMGIDADMVEMKEQDAPDEMGKPMAEYEPTSGKINVFPEGFAHGKMELVGTLAHEFMHAKFHKVIDQLNAERKEFLDGKDRRELKVYNDISPVFSTERASYEQADGQSKYSTLFWNRYNEKPSAQTYMNAVNETLAEVDFLHATGREGDIHPLWRSLQNRVNNFAKAN